MPAGRGRTRLLTWIRLAVVAIVLGACLSSVVAWSLVMTVDEIDFDAPRTAELRRQGWGGGDEPLADDDLFVHQAFRDPRLEIVFFVDEDAGLSGRIRHERAGWPARSLGAWTNGGWVRGGILTESEVDLLLPSWTTTAGPNVLGSVDRVFPLTPLWPGFAINVLIYGVSWFVLLALYRVGRGVVRVKRRRCFRCGYPAGQASVCTECGGRLRPQAGASRPGPSPAATDTPPT